MLLPPGRDQHDKLMGDCFVVHCLRQFTPRNDVLRRLTKKAAIENGRRSKYTHENSLLVLEGLLRCSVVAGKGITGCVVGIGNIDRFVVGGTGKIEEHPGYFIACGKLQ